MAGLLGKKIGMTSVFGADGKNIPCTVIEAGPCVVTQLKTVEKDGYEAVQVGFMPNKAEKGHFDAAGVQPMRHLMEFDGFEKELKLGDTINVGDVFEENSFVDVIGTSKGKGFQGVVKRHGFGGVGQSTHGQDDRLRAPGSVGACAYPSRIFPGTRMAGHMGQDRVTVQNLVILKVIPEYNLIMVKGSVPGAKNSIVIINK